MTKQEYIKDYLRLIEKRLIEELDDMMSHGEMITLSFESIMRMNRHILIEMLSLENENESICGGLHRHKKAS